MILFTYLYSEMTDLTFFCQIAPVINCLCPPNPKPNGRSYSNSIVDELELELDMDVPFKFECNMKNKLTNFKCKLHLKNM